MLDLPFEFRYTECMKNKNINNSKFKYIFFPEDMEMYQIHPPKLCPTQNAFQDTDIINWGVVEVAIGEDLIDLGYKVKEEKGCESSWYILEKNDLTKVPYEQRYQALIGIRA